MPESLNGFKQFCADASFGEFDNEFKHMIYLYLIITIKDKSVPNRICVKQIPRTLHTTSVLSVDSKMYSYFLFLFILCIFSTSFTNSTDCGQARGGQQNADRLGPGSKHVTYKRSDCADKMEIYRL